MSSLGQELCLIYIHISVPCTVSGMKNGLTKDLLNETKNGAVWDMVLVGGGVQTRETGHCNISVTLAPVSAC